MYIWRVPRSSETPQRLAKTKAYETDARLSPKGSFVAYIRAQNLYIQDLKTRQEYPVTQDGGQHIAYGMAEFIAQEEMGRDTGYWISPDDRFIAYTRTDDSKVPLIKRTAIGTQGTEVTEQRYPRAGEENVKINLFVFDFKKKKSIEVNLGQTSDVYLARVNWGPGDSLYIQRQNREQTRLDLLRADPETGVTHLVLSQTSPAWINLSYDFIPLKTGGFLWTSEQTDFRHIMLYDEQGQLKHQVTSGNWPVARLVGLDENKGLVYFEGFKDTPLERQLYVVDYLKEKASPKRLTKAGGSWSVKMNKQATAFLGSFSNPKTPPQTGLYNAQGDLIRWIEENPLDTTHPYFPYKEQHSVPDFGTLTTQDGTTLYYSLLKPSDFDPHKRYPVILQVYGGPHVQTVRKTWGRLFDQLLVQRGYLVFRLDNRGSANRGTAFETAIHRRFSEKEVEDQLQGVDWLKKQSFVDPRHIGVMGWSYGGYMTLMLMLKAPKTFAAGVAGAPVTDWGLYDTHYTERYMGTPEDNPEGYKKGSVLTYADKLEHPLLLVHGLSDDNVLFEHSARLIDNWARKNLLFETMLYPGQTHKLSGQGHSLHFTRTALNFFDRYLGPQKTSLPVRKDKKTGQNMK